MRSSAWWAPDEPPRIPSGIDILFVCTGNICRSPMAEAILARRLSDLDVPAHVHSAGLLHDGVPAPEFGVGSLARRGIDISGHRSRLLGPPMVEGADLIIGMARRHIREVAAMSPDAWQRAFTLKEIVRRGEAVGRRVERPLADWLADLHGGRKVADLLGDAEVDDVFDPIGCSRAVYDRTAAEIDDLVNRFVDLAFASSPTTVGNSG